jgi:hypothetical protein
VQIKFGKSKNSKGVQRKNAKITIPESKTDIIKRGVTMRMRCCCEVEGTQLANGIKLCPVRVFTSENELEKAGKLSEAGLRKTLHQLLETAGYDSHEEGRDRCLYNFHSSRIGGTQA